MTTDTTDTIPEAIDLSQVAGSERESVIASMTDEQLFAARLLLVAKIREVEAGRAVYLTRGGEPKARLSERDHSKLWTIDYSLGIYHECVALLEPAHDAACQRRIRGYVIEDAHRRTVSQLRSIAARLGNLAADIAAYTDVLEGEDVTDLAHVQGVSRIQHDILWMLPNLGLDTLMTTAAQADGLDI